MTSTDPNRKPVPQNRLRRPAVYSALALAACTLWGTAFPCIKLGYEWGEISGPASQILFAGIRERVDGADVPVPFRGVAISMVTAGLMSLAFMGFAGLDKYQ